MVVRLQVLARFSLSAYVNRSAPYNIQNGSIDISPPMAIDTHPRYLHAQYDGWMEKHVQTELSDFRHFFRAILAISSKRLISFPWLGEACVK
jgi:hypothetical protein